MEARGAALTVTMTCVIPNAFSDDSTDMMGFRKCEFLSRLEARDELPERCEFAEGSVGELNARLDHDRSK